MAILFSRAEPFAMGNFGSGHYDVHFCDLDRCFWRRCCFKIFLISSAGGHLVQRSITIWAILAGHYEDKFCEIILKLDQWLRCLIKIFLIRALVAMLFGRVEPNSGSHVFCRAEPSRQF